MGAERAEALEVLRDVWRAQAQTVADLDDSCESHCKKMTDAGVGFDDYAAGDAADRITAWRARLAVDYPRRDDGVTLFPFSRLFVVARRD